MLDQDDWRCPTCLDLLFKPAVNTCGHVYCFWCFHRAMSPYTPSTCPVCRAKYGHLPAVRSGADASVLGWVAVGVALQGRSAVTCAIGCVCNLKASPQKVLPLLHAEAQCAATPCTDPQICAKLHCFLAAQFPEAYAARREETEGECCLAAEAP